MGVLAGYEGHLLLGATILCADGDILGSVSPFAEIPGLYTDFSNAIESVSYGDDLGGLASLQLSKGLSERHELPDLAKGVSEKFLNF